MKRGEPESAATAALAPDAGRDDAPGLGTAILILVFLGALGVIGYFSIPALFEHEAEAPPPPAQPDVPAPLYRVDSDGNRAAGLDQAALTGYLAWCGIAAPRRPFPYIDSEQCESLVADLRKLGEDRSAKNYGQVGRYFHFLELFGVARSCYENALRLAPEDFTWDHYLGYVSFGESRFDEAERWYQSAIEKNPTFAPTYMQLARTYTMMPDRTDDAERCYQKARELDPGNPYPYSELGRIALDRGQNAEAIALLEQALERQEGDKRSHNLLALAYARLGDEAKASYHNALGGEGANLADPVPDPLVMDLRLKTNSQHYLEMQSDKYYKFAKRYGFDKYGGGLVDSLRQLIARDTRVTWKVRLAEALTEMGQLEEAERVARAAIEQRREMPETHVVLGLIHFRKKEYERGIEKADDALVRDPLNQEAYQVKLQCLGELKRWDEGLATAEEALRHKESNPITHRNKAQHLYNKALELGRMADTTAKREEALKLIEASERSLLRAVELSPANESLPPKLAQVRNTLETWRKQHGAAVTAPLPGIPASQPN